MRLIRDSNGNNAGDPLTEIEPFAFDPHSKDQPSMFELIFFVEVEGKPTRFQYGFLADSERIHEEWLYAFPKGYSRCWFHREEKAEKPWQGSALKGTYQGVAARTNKNVLFLSKAGGAEGHPRLEPIYMWLKDRVLFMDSGQQGAHLYTGFSRDKFKKDLTSSVGLRQNHATTELRNMTMTSLRHMLL